MMMMDRTAMVFIGLACLVTEGFAEDVKQIKDLHKSMWESIGTLHFIQENALDHATIELVEYNLGEDQTRSLSISLIEAGKKTSLYDFRDDGRRRITFDPGGEKNNVRHDARAVIQSQESSRDDYRGVMTDGLWVIQPRGKPIWKLIDAALSAEEVRDESGDFVLVKTLVRGNSTLNYELDPGHDWLPRRIYSNLGEFEIKVDRFAKVDGYWFPIEGRHVETATAISTGAVVSKNYPFVIKEIRFNRKSNPTNFSAPKFPDGTIVADWTKNKTSVIGARKAGGANFRDPGRGVGRADDSNASQAERRVVTPASNLASYVIGISAGMCLLVAIAAKIKAR